MFAYMRQETKGLLVVLGVIAFIILVGMQWQKNAATASYDQCVGRGYLSGLDMKDVVRGC